MSNSFKTAYRNDPRPIVYKVLNMPGNVCFLSFFQFNFVGSYCLVQSLCLKTSNCLLLINLLLTVKFKAHPYLMYSQEFCASLYSNTYYHNYFTHFLLSFHKIELLEDCVYYLNISHHLVGTQNLSR